MKLEEIGFYTLSNNRALNTGINSKLMRCELILTDRCNFRCPYCRGLRSDCRGDMPIETAKLVLSYWIQEGLQNVRFTGGEPTLYRGLPDLIKQCENGNVNRIAISTNGSASRSKYVELLECGVNDFSISLDGCCSAIGDVMSGGIGGAWEKVVNNIRWLSRFSYVTVGMVFNEDNVDQAVESVKFADSLGVSDIRIVPSAQYNKALTNLLNLDKEILNKYPILKYRIDNINNKKHVRGMQKGDCAKCWLALDDMAIAGQWHFPCIIHLREGGDPIGKIGPNMRQERADWIKKHDAFSDPICLKNCLDVCRDFNNVASKTHN